jgi:hypothetical protein
MKQRIDLGNGAEFIIHDDGTKVWLLNGMYHRVDGPCWETVDGDKQWCQNDELHRLDGPAVEWCDGRSPLWFISGKEYSEEEFNVIKEVLWML